MTLDSTPQRNSRYYLSGLVALGLLALLIIVPGCKKPAAPPAQSANSEEGSSTKDPSDDPDCNSYIDNAMSMLEPERLGISSSLERAVGLLNDWTYKCGNFDTKPPVLTDSQKPFFKDYLGEAQLAKMDLTRFTEQDGKFIRDAQLFHGMVNAAIEGQKNDRDRATAAFNYCMVNLALIPSEKNRLPLSPYELCILGLGTPEQRAWIYIDMLRQLRIDAVLFRPAKPSEFKLLVGVLIEDEVYLFDPVLGLPVPAKDQPADAILIPNPASLADVYQSPEILKDFYGAEAATRFSTDDLKTAEVVIMGRSCEWSARMRRLEDSLSRKQTCVLFRNLDEFEGEPGFIAHIKTIGKGILKDATIKVSEFPDNQINESEAVTGDMAQLITNLKLPFRAPVPFDPKARVEKPNRMFEVQWGPPTRKLLKTRTAQLMGDQQTAIASYVTTRLEAEFPIDLIVPPETRVMHRMAAIQAAYFVAVGQYLQGEYQAAGQSFYTFEEQFGQFDPLHKMYAQLLGAYSNAKVGKLNAPVLFVSESKPPEALKPAFAYFEKRWRSIRDKAKQE